jgi:anti-sigma factor RsiW
MRCNKAKKSLTALLDDELDEKLRSRIEDHLIGCAACQSERKALERVRDTMGRMETPAFEPSVSPEAILDRVRSEDRVSAEGRRGDRGRSLLGFPWVGLRPSVALVTGLVAIALVWLVPFLRSIPLPSGQEILMVESMELFENLDLIQNLSLLESLETEEGQGGELS